MKRRSPASMTNPCPTGAVCAWTVVCCISRLTIGDTTIPIIIATAQRFAAFDRRHLNGDFTLMISPPLTCGYVETHVEQLRPIGGVGLLSVDRLCERVRAVPAAAWRAHVD